MKETDQALADFNLVFKLTWQAWHEMGFIERLEQRKAIAKAIAEARAEGYRQGYEDRSKEPR
jgi:flagellar biosynthesis/type III secretory pathway protein FliH